VLVTSARATSAATLRSHAVCTLAYTSTQTDVCSLVLRIVADFAVRHGNDMYARYVAFVIHTYTHIGTSACSCCCFDALQQVVGVSKLSAC
jgi:hypothetical protein